MERDSEKPARAGAVKGRGEADRGIGHLRAWLIRTHLSLGRSGMEWIKTAKPVQSIPHLVCMVPFSALSGIFCTLWACF